MYNFIRGTDGPAESVGVKVSTVRQFMPKGRQLRKRCGQYKTLENYARSDALFGQGGSGAVPPPSPGSKLVMPSCSCLKYLSAQLKEIRPYCSVDSRNFMLLQTCFKYAAEGSGTRARELTELMRDESVGATFMFFNEFHKDTFCPILEDGPLDAIPTDEAHRNRLVVLAANYLSKSLGLSVMVLLSHSDDPMAKADGCAELSTVTMDTFVRRAEIGHDPTAVDVLQSLHRECDEILTKLSALGSEAHESRKSLFRPHESRQDLEKKHKSGAVLRGHIVIERGNSEQADVVLAGHRNTGPNSALDTVRVISRPCINRAMNGDVVFVQLHPRSQWISLAEGKRTTIDDDDDEFDEESLKGDSSALNQSSLDGVNQAVPDIDDFFLIPTGAVVGLYSSPTAERDVVAYMPSPINLKAPSDLDKASEQAFTGKEESVLVIPSDRSLPRFRVSTRQRNWLQGKKIVIRMDGWSKTSAFPSAHVVRCLGNTLDFATEMNALLLEHSIYNRAFSVQALACLPVVPVNEVPEDGAGGSSFVEVDCCDPEAQAHRKPWSDSGWKVPPEEIRARRDFRACRTVFSIDPRGCQDIDDSMHVHWVRPGVLELGVHIADVCAFLRQDSPLDLEAKRRGTTVYLTHCRIDMLPPLISSDIASLHGGKERLAMTVLWELTVKRPDGSPAVEADFDRPVTPSTTSTWYKDFTFDIPEDPCWCGRSVIKSAAAMTYEQADKLITSGSIFDEPQDVPEGQAGRPVASALVPRLVPDVRALTLISRTLLLKREKAGCVDFSKGEDSGGELKFVLGGNGNPLKVEPSKHLEVHSTVEELMILSNSSVAKIISEALPLQALVRIHAPPPLHKLENVRDFCEQIGVGIFQSPNAAEIMKQIPKFQSLLLGESSNKQKGSASNALELMGSVLIRAMSEAAYVSTGSLSGELIFEDGGGSQASVKSSTQSTVEVGLSGKQYLRKGHYGLGVLHYTHFTSPIRRYADIIVHRQLLYALSLPQYSQKWGAGTASAGMSDSGLTSTINAVVALKTSESTHGELFAPPASLGSGDEVEDLDDFMDSLLEDVGEDLVKHDAHDELNPAGSYSAILGRGEKSADDEICGASFMASGARTEASSGVGTPPYNQSTLFKTANDLNTLNRNSKWAQAACQKLFLTLYFKSRVQECSAVVYSVKENGVMVYVPAFDFKGSIKLVTRTGGLNIHSNIARKFKISDRLQKSPQRLKNANPDGSCSLQGDVVEYHGISCALVKGHTAATDDNISVLRLSYKRESQDSGATSCIFELRPLQKIKVLMSVVSYGGGGSEIALILYDLVGDESVDSVKELHSHSGHNQGSFLKKVVSNVEASNNGKDGHTAVSRDAIDRRSRSIYSDLQFFLEKHVEHERSSRNKTKNQVKIAKSGHSKSLNFFEFRLKGTGRICFGSNADEASADNFVSEMFLNTSSTSSTGNKSVGNEAKSSGFLTGKAAAIDKMKIWGEEWAEEEDLPGAYAAEDDDDDGPGEANGVGKIAYRIGGSIAQAVSADSETPINLGRTIAMATQRQQKLKVAKRNSKY